MASRIWFAVAICLGMASTAAAQVVRFETSIGEFDMVLNPTNNPRLQGHVDNLLQYVENNAYRSSWINRADEGFVLQMGGFYAHTKRPPLRIASTRSINAFAPVLGEPGIAGLSNTTGTVAMALPGGAGGTNQDGGTTSFFVNVGSNAFLDTDFTVFAAISDMTVINEIMALMQIDRTTEPDFGAGGGNLAFSDVPLQENGFQVFIQRAFVINDTMSIARAMAGVQSVMAHSVASAGGGSGASRVSAAAVPEPGSGLILLAETAAFFALGRRFRRR